MRQRRYDWRRVLVLLWVSVLVPVLPAVAATYYVSPSGSDSASGTAPTSAWKTFPKAVSALRPGDTLILLDGTYTAANCGGSCAQGFLNLRDKAGTAQAPITIKADHERQAYIAEDGTFAGVNLSGASYLILEGLRISTQAKGRQSEPVYGVGVHHLTFRRLLVHDTDNRGNAHLIDLEEGNNILIEETELYDYHRHAILLGGSGASSAVTDTVVRRVYCNSRPPQPMNYPLPAGTTDNNAGDACIALYPASRVIIENTIAESTGHLTEVNGVVESNNSDNAVLGSITLDTGATVTPNARGYAVADMPRNIRIAHTAAVGITNRWGYHGDQMVTGAFDFTGCLQCTVTNATVIAGWGHGVQATDIAAWVSQYAQPPSLDIRDTLVTRMTGTAFRNVATPAFTVDHAAVAGNGADFSPPTGRYTATRTGDPGMGTCLVYLPDTSPLKHAGTHGAALGADILYRYQDGTLTTVPLWDPTTGAFPCGATAAGVNDDLTRSCRGVHQRLNVNSNGCAFPAGYSSGGPPAPVSSLPAPTGLRLVP